MDDRPALRLVPGAAAPAVVNLDADLSVDPLTFQARCLGGFVTSQVARGFSPRTIENGLFQCFRGSSVAGYVCVW